MTRSPRCWLPQAVMLVSLAAVAANASDVSISERTIQVNDQLAVSPGYAVGDIAIAAPRVADYKVIRGRREILIFGKGVGTTRLTIWDQRHVKRDEVLIRVVTALSVRLERDLREALTAYPGIHVNSLGDVLTLTGTAAKHDQPFVSRVAAVARAQDLVQYVDAQSLAEPKPNVDAASPSPTVRFQLTLLETNSQFRSGSYASGVEPSGRVLTRCAVVIRVGERQQVFIGDRSSAGAKSAPIPVADAGTRCPATGGAQPGASDIGIRLAIEAGALTTRGTFPLRLHVETNLPVPGQPFEPEAWRRTRLQMAATAGEPVGIAGADLLAAPAGPSNPSLLRKAQQASSAVVGLPGVSRVPGLEYGPIFGNLFRSKSPRKSMQLLLLLTPIVDAAAPVPPRSL